MVLKFKSEISNGHFKFEKSWDFLKSVMTCCNSILGLEGLYIKWSTLIVGREDKKGLYVKITLKNLTYLNLVFKINRYS